jgi:hypothetical protein
MLHGSSKILKFCLQYTVLVTYCGELRDYPGTVAYENLTTKTIVQNFPIVFNVTNLSYKR